MDTDEQSGTIIEEINGGEKPAPEEN
jgi:hypothetical protein